MISHGKNVKVFCANANRPLAEGVCRKLWLPLGDCTVTTFADGEISVSINETVRGSDVFLVQSTCKPVNNNLMELLIMIDACRRASAGRITAVIPYFGYARQDRKAKSRDPISSKLVANMIEAAGADRVLTMDLHASQIQGFFDIPVDNLFGNPIRGTQPRLRQQDGHGSCHRGQAPRKGQPVRGHEHHRRRQGQALPAV